MTRHLTAALLLAILFGSGFPVSAAPPARRPNILFIFSDDHAAHAIGAYGSKINKTPNLDRLAAQGTLFRNCFVTNSICGPSRAVILTGKYSHLNGFPDNRAGTIFDGSQQTFPKLLQQAGYQTALIGKWHLRSDPTGFDYWNILAGGGGQGTYYNPEMASPAGTRIYPGYTTDIITDQSLEWLKGRDPNKPFMLMCQHKAPHREWDPDPPHMAMYEDVKIPEPATLFDDYSGRSRAAREQQMSIAKDLNDKDVKLAPPPKNLTPEQRAAWDAVYGPRNEKFRHENPQGDDLVRWKYQRYIKDYLRCIASVDDNIGRVLAYLDETGLADNTVVIYSSDQGFYLGDHGWYDKRWMYEESLRTPFIVRWPGVSKPGSEDRHIVLNLDYTETFLDLAGAPIPRDMQGTSLVPLLRGESPADWRTSMYYHYYEFPQPHHVEPHFGVRTERHKLIYYYRIQEWELFDLEKDPHEMKSVAADPAYADVLQKLQSEIKRLQTQYGDTNPETPPVTSSARAMLDRARQVKLSEVLHLDQPDQQVRRGLDPTGRPLTLGARCVPATGEGVIIAQGGPSFGYALFLADARPHFLVRTDGESFEAVGLDKLELNKPVHVVGILEPDGLMRLLVDGRQVAEAPGQLLPQKPGDGVSVGFDSPATVGNYESPAKFVGQLTDIRLYWGVLDPAGLAAWAGTK